MEDILKQGENVYEFKNYHYLDAKSPSKSRLKKCEKGLHEFTETHHDIVSERIFIKRWACKHCGISMHDRR
jgi:hypothetical protein